MISFEGKKVIVTGASSGVGRETAILLSKIGATVVLIARRSEELEKTMSMMSGNGHSYKSVDLSDFNAAVQVIKDSVKEDGQKFDGVAHCAGAVKIAPIRSLSEAILDEMLKINFFSFAAILKCAASKNLFNAGAAIIAISSDAALYGQKGNAAYGAAKAAMNGLMMSAARELIQNNIRVNTICPGGIYTEMVQEMNPDPNVLLTPSEVANILAFYIHPCSQPITATSIAIQRPVS